MRKVEFIEAVVKDSGTNKAIVTAVWNSVEAVILKALQNGDDVNITGFGKFKTTDRAAKKGFNLKTKQIMEVPAYKAVVFKAGRTLKSYFKN